MNRISVEDILKGHEGNLFTLQVRRKRKKTLPTGEYSIIYVLADATGYLLGEKLLHYEEDVKIFYDEIEIGDICELTGSFSYENRLITINSLKKIQDFHLEDFIKNPKIEDDLLLNEIKLVIEGIKNPHLKNLSKFIFQDEELIKKFRAIPSATKYHHSYPKGNLQHIVSVIRICKTLLNFYETSENPYINIDLLLTGVIFHDVGKALTYKINNGIASATEKGAKIDHIVLGNNYISSAIQNFKDFPENLKLDLLHLILSHHGRKGWGSPVTPKTPEAEILHLADLLDSRFKKALEGKFTVSSY